MIEKTQILAPSVARCRACDAALPEGATTCANCGAVYGEENRCPHCRVIAGVDVRAGLGRCRVCGGPRIAVADPSIPRSNREFPLLLQAQRAALGITVARFGGYATLAGAAFTGSLALLVALLVHSVAAPVTLGLFAALLAVVGAVLSRRARKGREDQKKALDQAEVIVAADLVATRPRLGAPEVAQLLGTTAEQAELLLAEVNVNGLLGSGMTDASRERIAIDSLGLEPDAMPKLDETLEAPPLGAGDIPPPLAGPGRRS